LIRHGKRIRRQVGRSSPKNESAARRSKCLTSSAENGLVSKTCPIEGVFPRRLAQSRVSVGGRVSEKRGNPRKNWCCGRGLNSRPLPYQGSALPLSYHSMPMGGICSSKPARSLASNGKSTMGAEAPGQAFSKRAEGATAPPLAQGALRHYLAFRMQIPIRVNS
jgi:hypothetical protein